MTSTTRPGKPARRVLLVLGIMLISANLRAPITGVGPLLDTIRASFGLSAATAGLLTTLPLLAFAIVSPFAAALARRCGIERTLLTALLLLAVGILTRSTGAEWALFGGTALIGSAIAIGNVLLPGLLKRDFPDRIASMTSVYALTMGATAAVCSAVVIPLARMSASGWAFALAVWAVLALVTAAIWLPQVRNVTTPPAAAATARGGALWRSALAWQVTIFMGFNSFGYYIVVAWLPTILQDGGYSPAAAGQLHGVLQLATAIPCLLALPVMDRLKDQRLAACASCSLVAASFLGFIAVPQWSGLWTVLYGLGTGTGLILALAFMSLRASDAHQAATLSGMAQAAGYLLAAVGPILVGALHDRTGGWSAALLLCMIVSATQAVIGLYAGRRIQIGAAALSPRLAR